MPCDAMQCHLHQTSYLVTLVLTNSTNTHCKDILQHKTKLLKELKDGTNDTYVAGSTSSLSVDADDTGSDNAVDIVAVLVAHDGHADEVQELEKNG